MPDSRWLLLTAVLVSPGAGAEPWDTSEHAWLASEADAPRTATERVRRAPEYFTAIAADGNAVAPREPAGDEAKLMAAVRHTNVDAVRSLIGAGANPNMGDYWRNTPLLEAVRQDNLELTQILLDAGARPNVKGRGHTPLGVAARNGNVRLVEMLLRAGADPDRRGDDGDTPAHAAALMGHAAVIDALASSRPDWRLFNREGLSALAVAAANAQYAAAAALVRAGASVDWGDKKSHPPLWWAFSVGDFDMARLLLKLGAAPGQLPVGSL